jgi:ribonuclease P protein component
MLPKKRRISRATFPYIIRSGRRTNSPSLLLYTALVDGNTKEKETKISFSVSKKVCSGASDRNKHRRWGYSAVSPLLKNIKNGYYLFFCFKKTQKPLSFKQIQKEVLELLSVSGVLI